MSFNKNKLRLTTKEESAIKFLFNDNTKFMGKNREWKLWKIEFVYDSLHLDENKKINFLWYSLWEEWKFQINRHALENWNPREIISNIKLFKTWEKDNRILKIQEVINNSNSVEDLFQEQS